MRYNKTKHSSGSPTDMPNGVCPQKVDLNHCSCCFLTPTHCLGYAYVFFHAFVQVFAYIYIYILTPTISDTHIYICIAHIHLVLFRMLGFQFVGNEQTDSASFPSPRHRFTMFIPLNRISKGWLGPTHQRYPAAGGELQLLPSASHSSIPPLIGHTA